MDRYEEVVVKRQQWTGIMNGRMVAGWLAMALVLANAHGVDQTLAQTKADASGTASSGEQPAPSTSPSALPSSPPSTIAPSKGGKLPRPQSKSTTPENPESKENFKARHNCFEELLLPPGGNGVYSPDNKYLHLLVAQKYTAVPGTSRARYAFYQIDLEKKIAVPLMALNQLSGAALVTYVYPLQGVSAAVFSDSIPGCYAGNSSIVSISFKSDGDKAVKSSGEYSLVWGESGLQLFDRVKKAVVEVDYVTFQTRVARSVAAGDLPLFYKSGSRELFTMDHENRRLRYYKVGSTEPDRIMSLRKNERVSQRGRSFTVIGINNPKNRLFIKEVPFWSGEGIKKPKVYAVRLPRKFKVAEAAVETDVTHKIALVTGLTPEAQEKLRRVYILQYSTGKLIHSYIAPVGHRVGFARLSADGNHTVIQIVNAATNEQKELYIIDHKSGKKTNIEMLELTQGKG